MLEELGALDEQARRDLRAALRALERLERADDAPPGERAPPGAAGAAGPRQVQLQIDAEDAYSTSFHDDYESALKWLVAGPFLLATVAAIRRADRDALELDVLGASIPTSTQGLHEE